MQAISQDSNRSRSRSRSRSSFKRQRTSIVRVPRALKYNGINQITRTTSVTLPWVASAGWTIGAANYPAFTCTFSPLGATIYGAVANSISVPLPNAAEISALYDQVKIDKVEMTFLNFSADTSGSTAQYPPRYYICNDYNDAAVGTSLAQVQQMDATLVDSSGNKPAFKWTVKPKYQRLVYYTAVTSSFEPATGFVNSDTEIPHYGVKVAAHDHTTFSIARSMVSFKFFLSLKNIK